MVERQFLEGSYQVFCGLIAATNGYELFVLQILSAGVGICVVWQAFSPSGLLSLVAHIYRYEALNVKLKSYIYV